VEWVVDLWEPGCTLPEEPCALCLSMVLWYCCPIHNVQPPGGASATASTGIAAAAVGATIGGASSLVTSERASKSGVYLIIDDTELTIIHEVGFLNTIVSCVVFAKQHATV
jgi:hypothetical protein